MCVCNKGYADELEVAFNELHERYLDTCVCVCVCVCQAILVLYVCVP